MTKKPRLDANQRAFMLARGATGDHVTVIRGADYPLSVGGYETYLHEGEREPAQWRVYHIGPVREDGTVEVELVRD